MNRSTIVYGVSFAVHGALAIAVLGVHEQRRRETIAISVSDAKKKPPPPAAKVIEPVQPIEPKPEARRPKAPAPAPKADAPPPEAAPKGRSQVIDALPNLGISMDNGGGPGGIAVPQGPAAVATPLAASSAATPKVLSAAPKPDDCTEAPVKPKVKSTSQPAPTAAAREAGVEGRVRVEVSVGPDGNVTGARLVGGLGYGLDEASLEAARRATFQPATRCGKPVAGTIVMAFRFQAQ